MTYAASPAKEDLSPDNYQSLSPLAALALLLGLVSPAALIAPILMIVPAAAVGAGLLALSKIRNSDGALSGAALARWGIALGLACVTAALVRGPVRDALLRRQMASAASQWLTLLAGQKIEESLQLLGGAATQSLGPPAPAPGNDPPSAEETRAIVLQNMRNDQLARRLAELGTPLRIAAEAVPGEEPTYDSGRTFLLSHFDVRSAGGDPSLRVEVRMARSEFYEADGRPWRVESWRPLD
jgi:hypothetical protein